jgi:hypothetical protein
VNVKNFGVVGDGVTDDTAAIQAAIDYAGAQGGATVNMPQGSYLVSAQILINSSNVILQGAGASQMTNSSPFNQEYATRIVADAGFTTTTAVFRFTSTAGDVHPIHNVGLRGIQVDCADSAEYGVWVTSVRNFVMTDSSIFQPKIVGLQLDVITATGWTGSNRSTKNFNIDNITIRVGDTTTAAKGIVFDGADDGINVNLGYMGNVYVQHTAGIGIDLHDCDTVVFGRINTWTASTGVGIQCNGESSLAKGSCRDNFFQYLQCTGYSGGTGGIVFTVASGTGTQPALFNVVGMYSRANATPEAIFGSGCRNQVYEYYADSNDAISITDTLRPSVRMKATNAAAAGSSVGEISGWGVNSVAETKEFFRIQGKVQDETSTTEDGNVAISVMVGGTLTSAATVSALGLNLSAGFPLLVNGTQVVGAQTSAVADATDAASAITQLNLLLANLRSHGLIAT